MRDVLWWGALLMAVGLALGVGLMIIRKRFFRRDEGARQVWTLQQLRELHQRGELSDEEFENLRTRVVAEMSGRDDPDSQP